MKRIDYNVSFFDMKRKRLIEDMGRFSTFIQTQGKLIPITPRNLETLNGLIARFEELKRESATGVPIDGTGSDPAEIGGAVPR